jgi:ferredoxin-NADP reductase
MISKMIHKNLHMELVVKSLDAETPHYWSVLFDRPLNFQYEAGDWMDIEFAGQELRGGKTYSLSSSPTDSDLQITFRAGMSEFKNALQKTHPNDTLFITQFGNDYGFQLKKNQSSVLIAGGVGIAPFRSMLKEMFDNGDKNEVTLIYLNQNENVLFKDELDMWSKKMPNLSIVYISTREINRKKREKLIRSLIKNANQNFYISGPPGMVESNEHLLIDMGVQVRNIRIDSFAGY